MNEFDKQNPDLFKFGVFYYNKNDSAIFVPKPTNTGWTVNFAHPAAWVFIIVIVVVGITTEVYFK